MRFLSIAIACLLAFLLSTSASPISGIVDQATYEPLMLYTKWLGGLDGINRTMSNNLVLYTKYSPDVYQRICACPLENILMTVFGDAGTYGAIARNDRRHEIIVTFRGTLELTVDVFVDKQIAMSPLQTTGVVDVGDSYVHSGFLLAYNTAAPGILDTINAQVAAYPSYQIVVVGHSLGGAVASIAALSIKAAVPNTPLKLFTYGQPRTGNAMFSSLVESRIGTNNIFRVVHSSDRVPTVLPTAVGYCHFGHSADEYWNFKESGTLLDRIYCYLE